VTQLQLAMAFSALVNGGVLVKPRLVEEVRNGAGEVVYHGGTEAVRRVVSERVSAETREVLRQVVERGTGKSARLSRWSSLGKTGTAQIPGPTGYADGAYTGTFVGAAPAGRPRLLCAISVYYPDADRGYYGSKVAAPYVKQVLEQAMEHLDVPSDLGLAAGGP
jgi:cell division protein FtsI/penicillin-binding protein 2